MKILAIILNYRTADLACRCADLLRLQTSDQFDIAIVDNNSCVDVKVLESYCDSHEVLLLRSDSNGGFSTGNNVGLRYASEQGYVYALVVNPDVEVRDHDYLQKCLIALEQDPNIAVLGTNVVDSDGRQQNPMREPNYLEELLWPLETIRAKLSRRPLYHLDPRESGYCYKVAGCCFLVRISFMREIGFLDENAFLYCEEPILAACVSAAGLREYYLHDATAFHMHVGDGDLKKRNLTRLQESREYYLRHYAGYKGLHLGLLIASRRVQTIVLRSWGRLKWGS